MLFNSLEYLIFLPIVFILYWFVFKKREWQNLLIVIASYYFYGCWSWKFLLLIAFTTFSSYLSGVLIEKYEGKRLYQKAACATNIIINIGILCVFKYYNFFAESLADMFAVAGIQLNWVTLDVILPVGISFYTFQALSYTIDIYQHKFKATKHIVSFFAYVSFFPLLVAGPIDRASNLIPQFEKARTFSYDKAVDGLRQILWGLFKKMVVADNCAAAVNAFFGNYEGFDGFNLFCGGVMFTVQIYCDFSGYSDIALGSARLFGFEAMRNFRYPFFARDIAEMWRRWHISLTTWFRDYIYIPLGGSRCSKWKIVRNTLIIYLVSGLWHGANWTFVAWGAFHAALFIPIILSGKNRKYTNSVAEGRYLPTLKELGQMLGTFLLVMFGFIIFRAETITQAWNYIARIFTEFTFSSLEYGEKALQYAALMLVIEWVYRDREHGLQIKGNGLMKYRAARWLTYATLLYMIFTLSGTQATFIYFQF
ncbi:MAG: MBOAT family protein [Bacteroidaceae bacterium]|nr:MBOAT family protein [Bacteroidaceae bacterium]